MSAPVRPPAPIVISEQEAQAALDSFTPEERLIEVIETATPGTDESEARDDRPADHRPVWGLEGRRLAVVAIAAVLTACVAGVSMYRMLRSEREVTAAFSSRELTISPIGLAEPAPALIDEPTPLVDANGAVVDEPTPLADARRTVVDARSAQKDRRVKPAPGKTGPLVARAAPAVVPQAIGATSRPAVAPQPIGTTSRPPVVPQPIGTSSRPADTVAESRSTTVESPPPIVAEYRPPSAPRLELPAVPVPPARAAAVPAVSPPPATAPSVPNDRAAVQTALGRYLQAFSERSTGAVEAVWPTVDLKALERAFSQVSEQEFTFDSCQISVSGTSASAACNGQARYVPTVGNRSERVQGRHWDFQLKKANDSWLIDRVTSR